MTSGVCESSLSLISCTRQVKSHLIFVTPAGHLGIYTGGGFAAALYSHLRECGGADPGRRCEGSPCLSHCSLSVHESPLDCPKLAILLLYTHGCIHSYTQIQTKLQIHQALPENVWCKHLTWQTANTTLHKHKQAKEDNKFKRKNTTQQRRRTLRITTHKHIHIQTIEPQVPAASPTHAAKPEKQQYMVSIQRQKKDYFTSKSVSMIVRLAIQPRKDGENVQKYGRKKSNIIYLTHFWHNGCVPQKKLKSPKLAQVPNISYSYLTNVLKVQTVSLKLIKPALNHISETRARQNSTFKCIFDWK